MLSVCTLTLNPCLDVHYQVPNIEFNTVNLANTQMLGLGGKGINVSRRLNQWRTSASHANMLGTNFQLTTLALGGGMLDPIFTALANQEGLNLRLIPAGALPRINLHLREPQDEGRFLKVNAPGGVESADVLQPLLDYLGELKPTHLVLAGSIPPGLPRNTYAELLQHSKGWGAKTYVDCRDEPLLEAIKAKPDFVKVNQTEFSVLVASDHETPIDSQLVAYSRTHEVRICLTNGPSVVLYSDGKSLIQAQPPILKVGETVGAGDAFLAGWLAGELLGLDDKGCLNQALEFAHRTASNQV